MNAILSQGMEGLPLAQWQGGYGGMGPGMMGWGMGGGWFGFIFMILFWVVILAAAVAFIRWLVKSGASPSSNPPEQRQDSALEILRKRYARGEIDSEEFEQRKRALTED
jgi:putative membrane protein